MLTKQRLSFNEKSKSNFKWARETIDKILMSYSLDSDTVNEYKNEYERMLSNYQLYNNKINQKDFTRLCNPLGIDIGQLIDEIQPYNKAYNKIQVLLGEELKRPFNHKVTLTNQEGIQSKLNDRTIALRSYIYASLSAKIPELPQEFSDNLIPEEDIKRYLSSSYLSQKEITASAILNYLHKKLDLKDLKLDAFKHALLSAREFIYVTSTNDAPVIEILNPLGVFYEKSNDVKYIQEGSYAGYRTYLTSGEVLDKYAVYLTDDEIEKIDKLSLSPYGIQVSSNKTIEYGNDRLNDNPTQGNQILVQHVEWRSQRKVGFLTSDKTVMVDESFPVPPTAIKSVRTKEYGRKCTYYSFSIGSVPYELEWSYIPEIWTGTKIGSDIYAMVGPAKHQFRMSDDPTKLSLSYLGVVYNATNSEPVSLMDRMKPFLYLYFIVMHKLKKLVAQDNGRIFHFDTSMIDPQVGLEKTLYYLKELNIDFYNPLVNAEQPGAFQRGKVHASTDMSTTSNVMAYINLLSFLDAQISDVAGVSKQREGQILPGEAVNNANSNIHMSSVITEIYFHVHNKLWEKVLTQLLQVTKDLWSSKSVTKQYVLDDMSIASLELDDTYFQDAEFGVFVSSSSKEDEIFSTLRALSDRLLQSDRVTISDIVKIFKSTSIEDLETRIIESEKAKKEEINNQQAQSFQQQQELLDKQLQAEDMRDLRDKAHEIRIQEIESFKFVKEQDSNKDGTPDQLQIDKLK